jgi:hypothetical protein
VSTLNAASADEETCDVFPPKDAVNPAVHSREDTELVVGRQRRPRTEANERIVQLRANRTDVSERHGGCKERNDFLVIRILEAVDGADRIGGSTGGDVAPLSHLLESLLDAPEATGAVLRAPEWHAALVA